MTCLLFDRIDHILSYSRTMDEIFIGKSNDSKTSLKVDSPPEIHICLRYLSSKILKCMCDLSADMEICSRISLIDKQIIIFLFSGSALSLPGLTFYSRLHPLFQRCRREILSQLSISATIGTEFTMNQVD